jgi:hypothetical protein
MTQVTQIQPTAVEEFKGAYSLQILQRSLVRVFGLGCCADCGDRG